MRKMLVLTALVLLAAAMAGCRYCDGLRRGSLTQSWNAPVSCYEGCTVCTPEEPCGACESCGDGSSITTTTTKAPTEPPVLPYPGQ
ncbi:MAG: hypothetical protein GXX96_20195 [Planctomycetaceae bacterium]|nr:hypothetical protein [Planctomycetaceae bacterium]